MQEGTRSQTAEIAALQRALHLVLDDPPFVFVDDEIAKLLNPALQLLLRRPAGIGHSLNKLRRAVLPKVTQLRGQIVVRSRYTEDRLQHQLDLGLGQYVILSAGLDTFALRHPDLAHLSIYEVDQVDTQRWKRSLLAAAVPASLHFIPVDFEQQSIADVLAQSDFDSSKPAFFSWLGTTYYLSTDAISASLQSIFSSAASGSELVLDYWTQPPTSNWRSNAMLTGVRIAVALQSEPMLSFFKPEDIQQEVTNIGFEVLENFSPVDARKTYLAGRADRLDVPDFGYLLHLRVP